MQVNNPLRLSAALQRPSTRGGPCLSPPLKTPSGQAEDELEGMQTAPSQALSQGVAAHLSSSAAFGNQVARTASRRSRVLDITPTKARSLSAPTVAGGPCRSSCASAAVRPRAERRSMLRTRSGVPARDDAAMPATARHRKVLRGGRVLMCCSPAVSLSARLLYLWAGW